MLVRNAFGQVCVGFLAIVLVACQYAGATHAPDGQSLIPSSASAGADASVLATSNSPSAPAGETPRPTRSPRLPSTPRPDIEARLQDQARKALDRWADVIGDAPPNAIVFTSGLTRGGGWHGKNADDKKVAFYAGMLEATVTLATETPPPGEVTWPDGSTSAAVLLSASEALDDLIVTAEAPDSCGQGECDRLKVIGATLTVAERDTSRGVARVPVWEFEFAESDVPLNPITQVAVRDRVILGPAGEWDPYGDNPIGTRIEAAYGTPADTQLTVSFVGSPGRGDKPCGADYTAEAVESDLAVVVIVRASQTFTPDSPRPTLMVCIALGALRTATVELDRPLGDRTVLEVQFGTPVVVIPEDPPPDSALD